MADQPVPAAEDNYFDQYSQPAQAQAPAAPQPQGAATPAEVISPSEAKKRQDSGGYLADGKPAPRAAIVDTQQPGPPVKPSGQSRVAAADDDYFDRAYGKPTEPPAPPIKPVKPPTKSLGDYTAALATGFAGPFDGLLTGLKFAGSTPQMLVDNIHSALTGIEHTDQQDAWFKQVVEPAVADRQAFELGPDANFTEKLLHGIGGTLGMIDQAIVTGAEGAGLAGASTVAGRAAVGAASMSAPAAVSAVETGQRVMDATGDAKAASIAGAVSYLTNAASGAVPFGVGGKLATRVATAAATGPALGEVQRQAQNAAMPDSMKTPFDLEESAISALTSAPFGLMGGHNGEQIPRTPNVPAATEKPTTIMEHAQSVAAAESAANGGDLLDQTVAATHVNSVLSAHHDAAAVEGYHEVRLQQAAAEAETQRQEEEQFAREQALNQAKENDATAAPSADDAFAARENDALSSSDKDYTAAKNQVGDQAIERGDTLNAGAEKGGAGFEQPKLLDSLPPEQLQAFKTLAERRTAEMAGEPLPDESTDSKFTPYVEPKSAKPGTAQVSAKADLGKESTTSAEVAPKLPKPTKVYRGTETGDAGLTRVSRGGEMGDGIFVTESRRLAASYGGGPKAREGAGRTVHEIDLPELPPEQYGYIHGGANTGSRAQLKDYLGNVLHEYEPVKNTPEGAAERDNLAKVARANGMKVLVGLKDSIGENQISVLDKTLIKKPTKPPETLQERRESNGMQAPELPAAERGPPAAAVQAPDLRESVDAAAAQSAYAPESEKPTPTQAQYKAGNYQKGHVDVQGMDVSIEHPAGSERPLGNGETRTMPGHYGYVKGTVGADGMHVDMLIGKHPENETHFIVDHLDPSGQFEQHKVLTGFNNKIEAMRAYRKAYPDTKVGPVSEVKTPELKDWLAKGDTTKPFDAKGVNRLADSRETPRFGDVTPLAEARLRSLKAQREKLLASSNSDSTRMPKLQELQARINEASDQLEQSRAPSRAAENASGESSASLEAISRVRDEAAEGKTRHLIDPDGNSTPLTGVDAVDAKAPKSHIIAQADGEGGHTVVDRGGLSALHANGLLNRARAKGLAEPISARDTAPRSAEEADAQRAAPITKSEAERTLKPVLDKMGENVQVHDDTRTLPQHIQQAMQDFNHPSPRGIYDPRSDQVHIVAGNHESHDQLLRTAVHEIVGHQGMRHLLGSDWGDTMANVYRTVKNGSWVKDYAQQHGLDSRNPRHQALAADEYIAHLAERDVADPAQENPSVLRKAIDAVRSGLRKVGLVREWTDNDIRQLLRKSANNLAAENAGIRESAQARGNGPRFADKEDSVPFDAEHPIAQAHKFGKTMEEQANYNPGYLKSRLDWAKDKIGETIDARMAFIGLRNLPDFMDQKVMPSLRQFIRVHDQMDGRRGDLMNKAADLARDWSQYTTKDKARGGALGELMHASTLGGVDPSKPFEARYSDGEKTADATKAAHEDMRKDLHARLKEVFNKQLDDKGRELFNTVRDRYAQNRMEVFKALEARIMESGADNNTKKMIMAEMRQKFESGKVQGPYFPLARFGDHWASAKDKDGNTVSFSRFESASQKKAWIGEMKEKGFATDGGQRMDDKSLMERIDPKFVQKVTEMAKAIDPGLADEVWQAYLKAMPEMSMRKHFIHRVGRLGYSMDAMRAFAYNSFHGAHQLARLEYGNRLDTTLDNIKTEARAAEAADPTSKNAQWAPALAREMSRRYDWIKNPRSSPLASALTKFGFGWYLGAAPATAFRIFSQNPMLAQPMLAKFHGQLGATRELSRASAQWAMARGSLGDTLRGDERRAFDTADQRGMFSSTATQSLASGGAGEPMFTGTYYHVQKAMGYLFNAMEHHNRQTTYLAAYRLGRTQGMGHDEAVNHAGDLTMDSHFDYSNSNRPRVLQNDAAKVALLFKQYSWGVSYRLAREARDMFNKELTPEQNVMARKAFAGLLTRGMMFAGVSGLPLAWIATSVINAVMGDKDRPFDAEAAAHASLEQHLGKKAADAVMTGPVGAISGASLSGGASYNDLWYRPPSRDEKPQEQWSDLTGQLLGAIPAIGTNIATGMSMMHDGQVERGFEHFVPPEAAAIMKAYRYSQEGVTNLRGEPVLTRDELDNKDLFLQAIGFTPQKVADAYRVNTALKNVSQAVQDRREQLLNRLTVVSGMNDSAEIDDTMKQIEHFDSVNPGVAIGGKAIISSMRNRFKNAAESINGVRLPPGLNDLRDTYAPTEPQP